MLNTKFLILTTLFLVAFLERTVFNLGPNYELVTTSMILASYYFGRKSAFWMTLLIMAVSDRFIGNSNIFLFTWTGFLIPSLLAAPFIQKLITNHKSQITKKIFKVMFVSSAGIASNIFFFLWTNFGVWLLDSWGMYPNNLYGLLMSYVNALPFLKHQIISSLIFIPVGALLVNILLNLSNKEIHYENKFLSHLKLIIKN